MKIIKNNINNGFEMEKKTPDVLKIYCNECGSELEITENDTHVGWLGAAFITCPCCGEESMVEELPCTTLTVNNIEFPMHFRRTSLGLGKAKDVGESEIVKEIKRGVEFFRENKDEFCWFTTHGDLFLVLFRSSEDKEYWVVVTKDFYEADIPFEQQDCD